jgi:(4S)-4-hydroxy-5-phosphonooxypentane-2,3-dione isomerase
VKDKLMLVLVVEFHVKLQHVGVFELAMAQNAHVSLQTEPGCHRFDVCRDAADPTLFFLYELYQNEAAVQSHLNAPHYAEMSTLTAGWITHKSVRRFVLSP